MSLRPQPSLPPVPDDTARVARAAFRRGNPYLLLRDRLGAVFADTDFADLYPTLGQPAYAPWRLALVTLMPFREGLSDRQAAEAVRSRIDWKSLLALELADAGFDFSVLCEFRARLLQHGATERLLARLLDAAREGGLLKAHGRQRTDSTHVLAAVRDLSRLELLAETLRAALNAIAVAAPDWLHALAPLEWHERYDRRIEDMRLPLVPSVTPTPSRWAWTAFASLTRWTGWNHPPVCGRCRPSPCCAACGRGILRGPGRGQGIPSQEATTPAAACSCGRRKAVVREIVLSHPTTPRPASGPKLAQTGPAIWSTSPKPATKAGRIWWCTPTPRRPTCMRPCAPSRSTRRWRRRAWPRPSTWPMPAISAQASSSPRP